VTKDRLKEEISLYKLLMTIASAIATSVVGWLFKNIDKVLSLTGGLALVSLIFALFVTIFFLTKINTKIKELDYE